MAYEINRNVSDANVRNKSQAVMDAVNALVLNERHVNSVRRGAWHYHLPYLEIVAKRFGLRVLPFDGRICPVHRMG